MEQEVDLRQYIAVLIKNWFWIIGLAFVAALIFIFVLAPQT